MAMLPVGPPNMLDLSEHWLVDTGTCEDVCPSFEKDDEKVKQTSQVPPEFFETAKGEVRAATALKVTGAVNGSRIEPRVMTKKCSRAIALGKRVVRGGMNVFRAAEWRSADIVFSKD